MVYQVPPNVMRIARNKRKRRELIKLLAEEEEEETNGCSLQKIVDNLHVGCRALPQRLCYLIKGTEKHPQVSSRAECPIYREVNELLQSYLTE